MNTEARIKQLEDESKQLKEKIAKLENMLTNDGMDFSLREIINSQVIKQEDPTVTTVRTVILADFPTQLPVNPAGVLIFTKKGKEYAVPYLTR